MYKNTKKKICLINLIMKEGGTEGGEGRGGDGGKEEEGRRVK